MLFCGASVLASTMLFSCQNDGEQPQIPAVGNDGEMIEFTATVNVPDEMRTRAAANGTIGSDGLLSFTREIDKLWYAVYYNGEYLYDSGSTDAPAPTKTSDGHFTVPFKFNKTTDFTKVYMFFWAGATGDNVTTNDVQTISDGINLNFKKRCVSVDPKYMNGNNTAIQEYDSFAGYVQLSSTNEIADYSVVATLHRPFAQIHILTDEFTFPSVAADFKDGVTVMPGFGSEIATSLNYSDNMLAPTTWYFDDSIGATPAYKQNEFQFTANNYEYTNTLSRTSPERTTFKERTMDYLGCYYVFAPIVKSPLKLAESAGTATTYNKINLAFRKKNDVLANSQFSYVELPVDGLKANNKYVIYNKATDDDDDNDGDGGFITKKFVLEVVVDPAWETPNTEIEK